MAGNLSLSPFLSLSLLFSISPTHCINGARSVQYPFEFFFEHRDFILIILLCLCVHTPCMHAWTASLKNVYTWFTILIGIWIFDKIVHHLHTHPPHPRYTTPSSDSLTNDFTKKETKFHGWARRYQVQGVKYAVRTSIVSSVSTTGANC